MGAQAAGAGVCRNTGMAALTPHCLEAECGLAGGEELLGLGLRGPSHSRGFYKKEPMKFSLRRVKKNPLMLYQEEQKSSPFRICPELSP